MSADVHNTTLHTQACCQKDGIQHQRNDSTMAAHSAPVVYYMTFITRSMRTPASHTVKRSPLHKAKAAMTAATSPVSLPQLTSLGRQPQLTPCGLHH